MRNRLLMAESGALVPSVELFSIEFGLPRATIRSLMVILEREGIVVARQWERSNVDPRMSACDDAFREDGPAQPFW
jgi:DNA-binding FadR family transcriptional regulator